METPTRDISELNLVGPFIQVLSYQRYETYQDGDHISITLIVESDSLAPEERSRIAVEEFELHIVLKRTALAEFVPDPLFLVRGEQGEIIGFAVRIPRAGQFLTHPVHFKEQQILPQDKYFALNEAVHVLLNDPLAPLIDPRMLAATNIQTDGSNVWFASCSLCADGDQRHGVRFNAEYILASLLRFVSGYRR